MNTRSTRIVGAAVAGLLTALLTTASHACPDYSRNGAVRHYSSDRLFSAVSLQVLAGGGLRLNDCLDVPGRGYVSRAPDFTIGLEGNRGRRLQFRVNSDCDAVLLVNRPDGSWLFDDDSAGRLDPLINVPSASNGVYDVWVGRLDGPQTCDAQLLLETF